MPVLPGVPVLRVGTYELASGEHTFTRAELASAVVAQADADVRSPRLVLGHADERWSALRDGDPAFGRLRNLRLADGGDTLLADIDTGHEWLTPDLVASAFPGRSIEARRNVTTASGRRFPLVLTALALLGSRWPAVHTLRDLERVLTSEEAPLLVASAPVPDALPAWVLPPDARRPLLATAPVDARVPSWLAPPPSPSVASPGRLGRMGGR